MATYSLKRFVPATTLTTSTATLYTVTSPATSAVVKQILVANYSASSASVSIYLVPSGSSASTANVVVPGVSISANSTITLDLTQVLNQGDFIAAVSSASSSINLMVSGYEVV